MNGNGIFLNGTAKVNYDDVENVDEYFQDNSEQHLETLNSKEESRGLGEMREKYLRDSCEMLHKSKYDESDHANTSDKKYFRKISDENICKCGTILYFTPIPTSLNNDTFEVETKYFHLHIVRQHSDPLLESKHNPDENHVSSGSRLYKWREVARILFYVTVAIAESVTWIKLYQSKILYSSVTT